MRLLELVGETGSISAAGRALNMSYRQAWMLIAEMNRIFREPLVVARVGGTRGGGAKLTKAGTNAMQAYRGMEKRAKSTLANDIRSLTNLIA